MSTHLSTNWCLRNSRDKCINLVEYSVNLSLILSIHKILGTFLFTKTFEEMLNYLQILNLLLLVLLFSDLLCTSVFTWSFNVGGCNFHLVNSFFFLFFVFYLLLQISTILKIFFFLLSTLRISDLVFILTLANSLLFIINSASWSFFFSICETIRVV